MRRNRHQSLSGTAARVRSSLLLRTRIQAGRRALPRRAGRSASRGAHRRARIRDSLRRRAHMHHRDARPDASGRSVPRRSTSTARARRRRSVDRRPPMESHECSAARASRRSPHRASFLRRPDRRGLRGAHRGAVPRNAARRRTIHDRHCRAMRRLHRAQKCRHPPRFAPLRALAAPLAAQASWDSPARPRRRGRGPGIESEMGAGIGSRQFSPDGNSSHRGDSAVAPAPHQHASRAALKKGSGERKVP